MSHPKVGIGAVSYNRPEYLEKCVRSIVKNAGDVVDCIAVYNDGSDRKYKAAYERAYKPLANRSGVWVKADCENRGVAYAKNQLLTVLIDQGCDWLFLIEDDIKVLSSEAITGYIAACQDNELHHLMFHAHGPANVGGPIGGYKSVEFFIHAVGAYCVYSRECLESVGLMDENFVCAWEHVEHSVRLAMAGYTTGPYCWADAIGSKNWLAEQPGSIDRSAIRPRSDWHANIINGMKYWHDQKSESWEVMFGPNTMLHQYALGLLAER